MQNSEYRATAPELFFLTSPKKVAASDNFEQGTPVAYRLAYSGGVKVEGHLELSKAVWLEAESRM